MHSCTAVPSILRTGQILLSIQTNTVISEMSVAPLGAIHKHQTPFKHTQAHLKQYTSAVWFIHNNSNTVDVLCITGYPHDNIPWFTTTQCLQRKTTEKPSKYSHTQFDEVIRHSVVDATPNCNVWLQTTPSSSLGFCLYIYCKYESDQYQHHAAFIQMRKS